MRSIRSAAALALLPLLAGCASGPVLGGAPGDMRPLPEIDRGPEQKDASEPAFCVVSQTGISQPEMYADFENFGLFRSIKRVVEDGADRRGCEVLVTILHPGLTGASEDTVRAQSAYDGQPLWEGKSKGTVTRFGLFRLAPQLRAAFQPGEPAYQKLAEGRAAAPVPASEPAAAPRRAPQPSVAAAPRSDVDELPSQRPERAGHALIIGIERYREKLPSADFAASDAKLTAQYVKRVLGYPEENVVVLTDDHATRGDFEKYFERWLPNHVEAGEDVFVYFSGHGAPNPKNGDAYLVPYDADPTYIQETGYPLKTLYAQLAKLPAKRVIVAMDSCFSGAGGRSVIAKGARPLVSVQTDAPPAKVAVLAAAAGDQISNTWQDKGHGLFTYYLLEGLKQKGSDFHAVFDYLKPQVTKVARREYNADQDPQWRGAK